MRRSNGVLIGGLLGACAFGMLAFPLSSVQAAAGDRQKVSRGAKVLLPDNFAEISALRDITPIRPEYADLEDKDMHEVKRWPAHHQAFTREQLRQFRDAARQRTSSSTAPTLLSSTTAGLSFDGVGLANYSPSGAPPDTNGAVGATQYVQWVNTAFAVFNKSTGAMVYGPANGNTLFTALGGRCASDNSGDPIVMYDRAHSVWIMMQFAVSASPYMQCVAVSKTSDATGGWNLYSYSFGTSFNDYPKGGVWPDGYYVTYNMFANGSTFSGAEVCAMDGAAMRGGAATASQQCVPLSSSYGGLLPAYNDGATAPPAGAPNYVIGFDDVNLNALRLWKFHVDWSNTANTTLTGPTSIPVTAFTEGCGGGTCVPQTGTTQKLDSLADRMMYRLAYRNFGDHESLVVNHSVNSSGNTGVRWYEIRNPNGTPLVAQQSTYMPDSTYRWMGSVAQDGAGNMLLGYSTSSSSLHPGMKITGRCAGDTASTMTLPETEIVTGAGSQTTTLSRWGDYSAMTIDPSDDATFWYTTEYIKSNGTFNWSTRIASFKLNCAAPGPDFTMGASPSSVSIAQGSSGTSTITVTSTNSFNSAVSLSASGLPSGVTASFSPASVTPAANGSASSTLTLTAASGATTGTVNVTVTGTSGSTSHPTTISLTVNPVAGAGLTNGGFETGSFSPWLQAGVASSVSASAAHSGSFGALVGSSSPTNGDSSVAQTFTLPANASSLSFWYKVVCPDTVTYDWATATLKDNISGTTTTVLAKTCVNPSSAWTQVNTNVAGSAGHSVTLTLISHDDNYTGDATYTYYDDVAVAVSGPDTTPPTTSITAPTNGATVGGTVTINASASDNVGVTKVEFYVDGAASPLATDTTSPYSTTWNTTGLTNGSSHTLASKAYDAAGNVGTSSAVTVTVNNSVVGQTAAYDSTLKAPKCATVGTSCDTGASLIKGRATLGPEPNASNTINASCADGTSGTFHSDESLDQLKIETTDGTALAGGKTVKVTATVWAYSSYTSDHLDLYYSANASSPTWTAIATNLTPAAAGAQTMTATFTLPTGSTLQAIRGQFRYTGSAGTCVSGSYNDRDDLVFATQ